MAIPPRHILSKSTFMYGCQCVKRLWLNKYKPEERDPLDEKQQAIFQRGTDLGRVARELFPGGVDASPPNSFQYQLAVVKTAQYIAEGHKIIYEAAFQYEEMLCAIDILVKNGEKWYAYEVKSSSAVKPVMLMDAAFQYFVITAAGLSLENIFIIHSNPTYFPDSVDEIDIQQQFTPVEVLGEVLALQPLIREKSVLLKQVVQDRLVMPEISTGDHCVKPYPCNFRFFCFGEIPDHCV